MTVPEKQGFQSSNLIFFLKEVKAEAASSLSALSTLKVPYLLIGDFLIHILGGFCYSVGPRFAQKDSKDLYELLPESLDPSSPETQDPPWRDPPYSSNQDPPWDRCQESVASLGVSTPPQDAPPATIKTTWY